jgi:glucokinase
MPEPTGNATLLPTFDPAAGLLVGIDVGGTTIEALAIDGAWQVRGRAIGPTAKTTPEHLLAAIIDRVEAALADAGGTIRDVIAVGMGVPGRVDPVSGEVANAVNLNLEQPFALGPRLAECFGRPVYLENDARVAALGAYRLVSREAPLRHMAYMNIGTGISAGLVLKGELYRGANGLAGEIGHIVVEPGGRLCACGLHGCLETVASGSAIDRLVAEQLPAAAGEVRPNAVTLYQQAERGDPAALAIVRQVSGYLGRALHWIIMAYDVERVVLGGGVTRAGAAFLDPILEELSQMRAESPLAAMLLRADKFSLLPAGYKPGAWGAAQLAHSRVASV